VLSHFEGRDTKKNIHVIPLNRGQTSSALFIKERIDRLIGTDKFIILDIGGYFADSFADIDKQFNGNLIGVIEDTENGHQKYVESLQLLNDEEKTKPVYSVARSPLKEPEDYLVGQSIVYSVERILRDNNSLLTNKRVFVIGYGKIGKSVASSLSSKKRNYVDI
jgi:adenosylhomocysteinase